MKQASKLIVIVVLLVLSFVAGYFFRSQSCVSPKVTTFAPPPGQTQLTVPTQTPAQQPETELVFSNYNSAGVANNPSGSTTFTLSSSRTIYLIQDYHWNSAKGRTPGTIALTSAEGNQYGPWNAKGDPGQGGVPDAYWTVYPNIEVPAGTYTIVDSDPTSWAQNTGSNGLGMSQVYAVK